MQQKKKKRKNDSKKREKKNEMKKNEKKRRKKKRKRNCSPWFSRDAHNTQRPQRLWPPACKLSPSPVKLIPEIMSS